MSNFGGPRSGDLFDRAMGDVRGGEVQFNYKDVPGRFHHSVYGDGAHFSWDTYPAGDPRNADPGPNGMNVHGTLHTPKGPRSW